MCENHKDISAKTKHYPTVEIKYNGMDNKGTYNTWYSPTNFLMGTATEQDCGTVLYVEMSTSLN